MAGGTIAQSYVSRTAHNLTFEEYDDIEPQLAAERDPRGVDIVTELLGSLGLHDHIAARIEAYASAAAEVDFWGVTKFKVGDVVEQVYNAHTRKSRILYPFRVEEIHFVQNPEYEEDDIDLSAYDEIPLDLNINAECGGIRYSIVRLVDGFVIEHVPESSFRHYLPYSHDAKVLCNVGGYEPSNQLLFPCSIQEVYISSPTELEYHVIVRDNEGKEEELNLPLDKLLRLNDANEARWDDKSHLSMRQE